MPDSLPAPDSLADAARLLGEAVLRLERASEASAAAASLMPAASSPDRALLDQAAARIDALILRLNEAAAKPEA